MSYGAMVPSMTVLAELVRALLIWLRDRVGLARSVNIALIMWLLRHELRWPC